MSSGSAIPAFGAQGAFLAARPDGRQPVTAADDDASAIRACEVPVNPELKEEFLEHALTEAGARYCFV